MLAVLLASISALSYGGSDYAGAIGSKDTDSTLVTFGAQIVSLATLVAVLIVFPEDHRTAADLAWGALGGVGAAIALVTLYRALALGPMSTAASTTALVSVVVPVAAGLLLGDRPAALTMLGVVVAIPAGVMVAAGGEVRARATSLSPRDHAVSRRGVNETRALSVVAGLGFALFFIALSRVSEDAGLFPLLGARGASIALLAIVLTVRGGWVAIPRSARPSVVVAGVLDCAANSFYLLALGQGAFIWVAAITSMYPVSTVLLARVFLDERLKRPQLVGIAGAAVALVLITIGAEI